MEDSNKNVIGFGAYINKIRLYSFMYIKGHNKLSKGTGNVLAIDHTPEPVELTGRG